MKANTIPNNINPTIIVVAFTSIALPTQKIIISEINEKNIQQNNICSFDIRVNPASILQNSLLFKLLFLKLMP